MPGGGGIEQKEAQRSCMYGGVQPWERSKNLGEDTLILGYGTGCGRGGPPRLKMPVNDGKVAPVLYEEDSGCGKRRRNNDDEV